MIPILLLLIPQFLLASTLDSLLADNRVRAGVRADELFAPLDKPDTSILCENMTLDYRFLLANMPLSDLALMTSEALIENIHLARKAKQSFGWGCKYPQDFFRSFVLPHRVSQEPFVHWRKQFLEEIGPRVKGLSMADAILEVNHWSHEKATYRPTDGRDQDPLTTIRSGFGRCEEEMILTICALRSVGIPARQCYTPYWAHSDDNHAWVEAWADGKWYYLGACEPAQELNQAWFSGPAQRAMLVVSTAYGDYQSVTPLSLAADSVRQTFPSVTESDSEMTGRNACRTEQSEPVLRRYGRSTLINSTAVYGPTKELVVKVVDKKGTPAKDVRVIFSLWNYGSLMPATSVMTDKDGVAKLVCGIGDWFVSAVQQASLPVKVDPIEDDLLFWVTGVPKALRTKIAGWFKDDAPPLMAFAHVKGGETEVTLKLDSATPAGWVTELEYTPPPTPPASGGGKPIAEVISAEGEVRGVTTPPPTPPASEGGKALADSLFGARLAWEDSVREAELWRTAWLGYYEKHYRPKRPTRLGYYQWQQNFRQRHYMDEFEMDELKGDSPSNNSPADTSNLDTTCWSTHSEMFDKVYRDTLDFVPYFRKARGNWPLLHLFFAVECPTNRKHNFDLGSNAHQMFLKALSDKDLLDYDIAMLEDHVLQRSIRQGIEGFSIRSYPVGLDCSRKHEYEEGIIKTRIDYEPSFPWRNVLIKFLKTNPTLENEEPLLTWLRKNITVESSPDRLGPPLTPAQCLEFRRGTEGDIERLYIGFCRVRGIPARRNPVTNQVERWEEGTMEDGKGKMEPGWVTVEVIKKTENRKLKTEKGLLTVSLPPDSLDNRQLTTDNLLYMKDWAVAKWNGNVASMMEFTWHEPIDKISWPQELPEGWYLLSSGKRRDDGSAAVLLKWFEVKGDVKLELRVK